MEPASKDLSKAYADAGVNINAANDLVKHFRRLAKTAPQTGVVSDIGGFGGLFSPNLAGMADPLLVASTDGVGTKLKLAIAWGRNDGVGIDLVAMSANDILVQGADPLFFLDYFACGKLDEQICLSVVAGVAAGCREAECALLGGETAEMPGMYAAGDYDLAGFCVGLTDRARLVDGKGIEAGNAIIGIASSGVHSNGYSLVRKILKKSGLGPNDPLPGGDGASVADSLLAPTAIYVKCVKPLLRKAPVKGMCHITGGGFYDNIPRILPKGLAADIVFGSWNIPPVFEWLKKEGELEWREMLQIFNCGIGFMLVLPQEFVAEALESLHQSGKSAWKIGEIRNASDFAGSAEAQSVIIEF